MKLSFITDEFTQNLDEAIALPVSHRWEKFPGMIRMETIPRR